MVRTAGTEYLCSLSKSKLDDCHFRDCWLWAFGFPVLYSVSHDPSWHNALFYLQIATPLILIAAPFIRIPIAKHRANNIHYIITDRQGFIIDNLKVKVLTVKDATRMEIVKERAGFTSLIFHRYSGCWNLIAIRIPEGFLGIANASDVKQLISKYWRFKSANQ